MITETVSVSGDITKCRLCGSAAAMVGEKAGHLQKKLFRLYRCEECGYAYIGNPWLDFAQIYSEEYYCGKGADPLINYAFELDHPEATVREYEWKGIVETVRSYAPVNEATKWLDFGAGHGGLVRHLRGNTDCEAWAYEHGWIKDRAASAGIPFLSDEELAVRAGTFDVVTAIEVLEHVLNPLEELARIRTLLRPGGLFFFTTGNAAPHRRNLVKWGYVNPEIHISFFEPKTLAMTLGKAGFRAEFRKRPPGFDKIIRFKILKQLGIDNKSVLERVLPWGLITSFVDQRLEVSRHPVGWAV